MARKNWSFSQCQMIRRCERKWFLSYGRRATIRSKDPILRKIAFLKKLQPAIMWRGSIVHDIIADFMKGLFWANKPKLYNDDLYKTVNARSVEQWQDSLRRVENEDPKSHTVPEGPILLEHYFDRDLNEIDLSTIQNEMQLRITNFLKWLEQNELNLRPQTVRNSWIENFTSGFQIGDIHFQTKTDFAIQEENRFVIIDWKTGVMPDEHRYTSERQQVCTYALWPYLELRIPENRIEIVIVFLGDSDGPESGIIKLSEMELSLILDEVNLCIESGSDILQSKDEYKLKDFDYAASINSCKICAFQEICYELLCQYEGV